VLDEIAKELRRCNDGLKVTWITVGFNPGPESLPPVGGTIDRKTAPPGIIDTRAGMYELTLRLSVVDCCETDASTESAARDVQSASG
jgi:hypothetical protein